MTISINTVLKKIICAVISIVFLVSCQASTYPVDHEQLTEEERIVIRFSHVVGEHTPKGLASRRFAQLVEEKTDGYVEVQVFPNSFLYKDGEELEALVEGDVQMIAPATSKLTSMVPEWQVFDLPFAFQNTEEVREYINGPVGKVLFKKLEDHGIYSLGFWDNGFKQMTNNRGPLIVPEDFEDLEFRIMASEALAEQFSLLGAKTRVETFDQVFSVLDNQQLNAQENTFSNIVNKNIHTVQDYLTVSNHGFLGYPILMNDAFWQSLPDDIQIIILEVMEEVTEWQISLAEEVNKNNYEQLKSCECIDIHELTHLEQQLWEEALTPLYESFKERFGAPYIEYLPKMMGEETPFQKNNKGGN